MTEAAPAPAAAAPTPVPPPAAAPAPAAPPAAPAAAPGPWWSDAGLKIGDNAALTKWIEGKNFPDLATALVSGMNADIVARDRNVLTRPDPKNLQGWDGWKDLGWEPDAAKYQLKAALGTDGKPAQHDWGLYGDLSAVAHEHRIPLAAAQALVDAGVKKMNALADQSAAEEAKQAKAFEDGLRQEWGAAFDEKRLKAAMTAKAIGLAEDERLALERFAGAPAVMKMLDRLSSQIGEDKLVTAQGGAGVTPWTARAELDRINGDPATREIMSNPRDPRYEPLARRRNELIAALAQTQGAR